MNNRVKWLLILICTFSQAQHHVFKASCHSSSCFTNSRLPLENAEMAWSYTHICLLAGFVFPLQNLKPVTGADNEAGKKLVMVNAVYRHGDRSPTYIYPNDPYKEDVWPQGLGMLTQKGMRQEYHLGQFLKSRYVTHYKLLNSTYIHKELYVRSSDLDRCLMSAQTQLNGLYPPHGHQIWRDNLDWQPIGIHIVPKNEDYLLRPFDYPCPKFFQLLDKDEKQPSYIKMSLKYKDMLEYVSQNTGEQIEVRSALKITDPLISEISHNLTQPDWVFNGSTYEDLCTVADFGIFWNFNTRLKARLTGGALVGRMIENMKLVKMPRSADNQVRKMYLYSAHDSTVSAFLSALQVFDGITPDYSSAAILELFLKRGYDMLPQLSVRVIYRFGQNDPRVLVLPGCEEFCPLDKFIDLTADVIPEDVAKECALEQEKCTCYKVIDYKPRGCYKDKKPKKDRIFTKTFGTVKPVDKKKPPLEEIFAACKELAEKEGYEIFGIQDVKKCVTTKNGKAVDLKQLEKFPSGCVVDPQGFGVGRKKLANFVYKP